MIVLQQRAGSWSINPNYQASDLPDRFGDKTFVR
jgi:hypothetical protein